MLPIRHAINPYFDVLKGSLRSAGVEVLTARQVFWRRVPRLVLVHWQEHLWAPGVTLKHRVTNPLRRRILLAVLRSLRRRGSTVVWFAHNQVPHAWTGSHAEWVKRSRPFFAEVDAVAHLTEASTLVPGFAHLAHLPAVIVRHPHYPLVDPVEHAAKAGRIGRVLLLGGLEQRKNAVEAVGAIVSDGHLTAVVTGDGRPRDPVFASPRVHVIEGLLDADTLEGLFDGTTVVLLNQAEQVNSGVLYLALSRGAPVLCPDTQVNRELRSLVGPDWIRLFRPPLSPSALRELTAQPIPASLPDLQVFSPARIGEAFVASLVSFRHPCRAESFDPDRADRSKEPWKPLVVSRRIP